MNKTTIENSIAYLFRKEKSHSCIKLWVVNDDRSAIKTDWKNHVVMESTEGDIPELRWFSVVMVKPELFKLCNTIDLPDRVVQDYWPQIVSKTWHKFEIFFHGSEITPDKIWDLFQMMGWFVEDVAPPFNPNEDEADIEVFSHSKDNYEFENEINWPYQAWSRRAKTYWISNFGKLPTFTNAK